jgi:hypothetical protein
VELQDSDVGLGCVAVTVPGPAALSDAISITAPTVRLDLDRVIELAGLLASARQMLEGTSDRLLGPFRRLLAQPRLRLARQLAKPPGSGFLQSCMAGRCL